MPDKYQEANKEKLKSIPGYRDGTYEERCDNCAFISQSGSTSQEFNRTQGWCKMFRAYVTRSAVCDKWEKRKPSNKRYYVKRGSR